MARTPPTPRAAPALRWLALVDRHHARLLRGQALAHGRNHLEEVDHLTAPPADREHGRPSPRGAIGQGGTVPFSREEEEQLTRFIRTVSAWLEQHVGAQAIHQLVLMAPGHVLGELRSHLPRTLSARIHQEEAELTHLRPGELLDHPAVHARLFTPPD